MKTNIIAYFIVNNSNLAQFLRFLIDFKVGFVFFFYLYRFIEILKV